MNLTWDQRLKLQGHNLTDHQLDALVILSSHPGGLTNRELTAALGKAKREAGNVSNERVKPLFLSGIICKKTKRKYKQHGVLLFINPSMDSLNEIKTQLETRIFHYYYLDREKTEKCRKKGLRLQQKGIRFDCYKPVTEVHSEIRRRLVNYFFLHKQLNVMHWNLIPENGNDVDIMVPKCTFCRNLRNDIMSDSSFDEKSKLHDKVEKWVAEFPFQYKHPSFIPNEHLAIWEQERLSFFDLMGWVSKKMSHPK